MDARDLMDRIYRQQRHIYDLTRKYYLLGRDELIADLGAAQGETVCEVGCGTARNLVKMARAWSRADLMGLDASTEMLKTARGKLARAELADEVPVAHALAQDFDPVALFGLTRPLDHIVFSYSLSMIPPWRESIDHALDLVRPGGRIHIVDFGDQAGLPRWFRSVLYWWLGLFHVQFRPELIAYLREIDAEGRAHVALKPLYRGYAFSAVLTRPEAVASGRVTVRHPTTALPSTPVPG
ncbi:class I SAM-dependent methyltransferase [Roseospira marina]|uniref:Class I SAM-dependent methyltransferase n=1 Tax=Roseospira marina TaxID=140057 RepID=A0A5M6IBL2_9PROT|nr:class I SAM-dependent methyltransferase [Roseospira marina]KAA5605646.1 class I SAM-dependent methyltransferase [Roseospira marina]MBB4313279.1 S-adenosylmethionine-diacylgycerolhomoserine-N-methyltransferase [Roseospira marina]MBB5085980.1 S-adenosylmethionine-diacylgycerolhomoserine-N-methyltransferase [Roseospira marina]